MVKDFIEVTSELSEEKVLINIKNVTAVFLRDDGCSTLRVGLNNSRITCKESYEEIKRLIEVAQC